MIVLDTHVMLWFALEPKKLSKRARVTLQHAHDTGEPLAISCFTLFEIARLAERRRIALNASTEAFLSYMESKIQVQPITQLIAITAARLPDPFPGDPADRIIAATALSHAAPLLTADERMRRAGVVRTVW